MDLVTVTVVAGAGANRRIEIGAAGEPADLGRGPVAPGAEVAGGAVAPQAPQAPACSRIEVASHLPSALPSSERTRAV